MINGNNSILSLSSALAWYSKTHIREELRSNLGRDTRYHEGFRGFNLLAIFGVKTTNTVILSSWIIL
jgi:hypothetical protein